MTVLLLALLGMASGTHADTLYKCTDDSGVVLYTNQKGGAKNCTVLSRELPVSTVATPAKPSRTAASAASPSDFPRVDGDTQRGRDTDRRRILEQELNTELQNLDKAKKALAESDATRPGGAQTTKEGVALHERNIEALKRELSNLK